MLFRKKKMKIDTDYCPICGKAFKDGEKIYTDGKLNYHRKCYDRELDKRAWEFLSAIDDCSRRENEIFRN